MDENFFRESLFEIVSHSFIAPGRTLACSVIINPTAGGFTIRSKWKSHVKTLNEYREKAKAFPERKMHNFKMHHTTGHGSGEEITRELLAEAEKNPHSFYLIVAAGGDGTSRDVMLALYSAPAHVRSNIAVLRLPLGTGNDGTDGACFSGALELLVNPVHIEFAPAVLLTTAPDGPASEKGPYLAFNILSVGLDAFVTHMTNKMKGNLPGDSYKLWVDIASVFYDSVYKVDYLDVRALNEQNLEIKIINEKLLLLAMGVTGHRTYGSQKKILPDDRNICAIKQMPLYRKAAIKSQVAKGTHINNPEVDLFTAHRLEFSGKYPILAQMDGETILLQLEDFPAAMELTAPVIPLLKITGA
ncbi:MAG: diacylglycerol kinase [Treponema sp.]|nr:diacylglycerol kinase [Treponema sp.]